MTYQGRGRPCGLPRCGPFGQGPAFDAPVSRNPDTALGSACAPSGRTPPTSGDTRKSIRWSARLRTGLLQGRAESRCWSNRDKKRKPALEEGHHSRVIRRATYAGLGRRAPAADPSVRSVGVGFGLHPLPDVRIPFRNRLRRWAGTAVRCGSPDGHYVTPVGVRPAPRAIAGGANAEQGFDPIADIARERRRPGAIGGDGERFAHGDRDGERPVHGRRVGQVFFESFDRLEQRPCSGAPRDSRTDRGTDAATGRAGRAGPSDGRSRRRRAPPPRVPARSPCEAPRTRSGTSVPAA